MNLFCVMSLFSIMVILKVQSKMLLVETKDTVKAGTKSETQLHRGLCHDTCGKTLCIVKAAYDQRSLKIKNNSSNVGSIHAPVFHQCCQLLANSNRPNQPKNSAAHILGMRFFSLYRYEFNCIM
jgi:hypothetical protein